MKKEEKVNMKRWKEESLFLREITHKGGESPLIQPRVLELLKNLEESLSLRYKRKTLIFLNKLNLFSLING